MAPKNSIRFKISLARILLMTMNRQDPNHLKIVDKAIELLDQAAQALPKKRRWWRFS